MSDCLDQDLVARFVAQRLSAEELQHVQAHLETCPACRRRVEANQATLATPASDSETIPEASEFPGDGSVFGKPLENLLENYRILEELPRGGQAVVYKAVHKPTKMKVALKVLLPTLLGSARARRAFEQEVDLVAGLSHPNIVRIHDSGVSRGQYYFSMEYIRGKPLDVFAMSRALDNRGRVLLFTKVCDAVACAHQRGVIHRDLKPSNILVDERGEPHILDFGLAKAGGPLGSTETLVSVTGEIKGTINYMSPEQAEGRSDLVDVRSDVYSLGVMLYQLLTGRFPYDVSGTNVQVIRAIQLQDPVRPRQLVSRFDSDLEAILLKCLAKERAQRYQSAAELHEELKRWLQGEPIVAKSVSSLYLLKKVVSRHRYTSSVVALLAIIVISLSYVSFDLCRSARRQTQRAIARAEQSEEQIARWSALHTEAAFLDFLEALRGDHPDRARKISHFVGNASTEGRAMAFLLDPNSVDKRKAFCATVAPGAGDPNAWFVDLVMGEDYLRHDRRREALQAYQRSVRAALPGDELSVLHCLVKARLYELTRAPVAVSARDNDAEGEPNALDE